MNTKRLAGASAIVLAAAMLPMLAQAQIRIGHLADYTGGTSDIGKPFGEGVAEAFAYINAKGGVNGQKVDIETTDYGYQVPRALATYKKWTGGSSKVNAIIGWGTADTEALINFVTNDKIPYLSGSYAGALTDPEGKGEKSEKPAPYNFFYGPSYSDALRAMLQLAADEWKASGKTDKPKYVHMGANHPYPNAPKAAGEARAAELGFEVLPAIQFPLAPGDFTAQCLTLKQSGANYAYLGNTAASNVAVMKACKAAGVTVKFIGNVWGVDENALKAAGDAGSGVIYPMRTDVLWGGAAPGMALVKDVAKGTDPSGQKYRSLHYVAGVCTAFYMKEALEWAGKNGGYSGENIKKGFYQKADWVPAGLEGVCRPATWSAQDHRPTTDVMVYRTTVAGSTEPALDELMSKGVIKLEKAGEVKLGRKPEWLGW
jgi:branched-chain amino acid transport system substrate-binding protein